jgi:tRNA pseudouridine55 synthase
VPPLDGAAIDAALESLRGVIVQVPPAFAALKIAGRPAYARARAGEDVTLAARRVQVLRLDVIATNPPDLRLLVVCSSGTYVRAIARDLGRALGSAAHLGGLRRMAVGALEVSDAISASEIRARGSAGLARALRPTSDALLAVDPQFLEGPATIVVSGDAHV